MAAMPGLPFLNNIAIMIQYSMFRKPLMSLFMAFVMSLPFVPAAAQTGDGKGSAETEKTVLTQWKAGSKVSIDAANDFGLDKCFKSAKLSDAVFERMKGKSYKNGCTIPRSALRYLKVLHYDLDGEVRLGEMVCDKAIAADLVDIFKGLFEAKYPIERMVLVDEYGADDVASMEQNNTTCFNYRVVAGSKTLSNHSKGRAIDVNPLYNPYVKKRQDGSLLVSPESGRAYADRSKSFKLKIDKNDLCYKLFKAHGFAWGGDWHSCQDYQHFEK